MTSSYRFGQQQKKKNVTSKVLKLPHLVIEQNSWRKLYVEDMNKKKKNCLANMPNSYLK